MMAFSFLLCLLPRVAAGRKDQGLVRGYRFLQLHGKWGGLTSASPPGGSAWVWRPSRSRTGKGNVLLLHIGSMLEAPVPLHNSAQSGSQHRGLKGIVRVSYGWRSHSGKQAYAPACADHTTRGS